MTGEPTATLHFAYAQRAASAGTPPVIPPTLPFTGYTVNRWGLVLEHYLLGVLGAGAPKQCWGKGRC